MKRSVEGERGRIVAALVLVSLLQDSCLLIANASVGVAKFFDCISTSFANFAKTFSWLFNDQSSKYQMLTGRSFTQAPPQEGDEEEDG